MSARGGIVTRVAGIGLALALVAGCATPRPAPEPASCADTPATGLVSTVRVVERHPHDPEAFTQGLVAHRGRLYESTGRYGESSIRHVELETGDVLRRVDLPDEYFGEGLALLDDALYQLTWREGIGFVYRVADLAQTDTFRFDGEGWGLTTDGVSLILSNGSSQLRFIEPGTFRVTRTIEVTDGGRPVEQLNELEWLDGEVWANVWRTDRIARIDPASGAVTGWVDAAGLLPAEERSDDPGAVLNGIAHDAASGRLFLTGKLWPTIFEVELVRSTPRCG